jgi:hypothetical protein
LPCFVDDSADAHVLRGDCGFRSDPDSDSGGTRTAFRAPGQRSGGTRTAFRSTRTAFRSTRTGLSARA